LDLKIAPRLIHRTLAQPKRSQALLSLVLNQLRNLLLSPVIGSSKRLAGIKQAR